MINKIKNYWLSLDRIDKAIILVIVLSFMARIMFLFYSPLRGWDETVYVNLGHDLSSNPLFYSLKNSIWSDFIPSSDMIYGWPNIGFRAPVLSYIISLFYVLKVPFLISFIIPVFATLSVYLVYVLGKIIFNKEVGLYSSVIFSLIPIHVLCSQRIWSDALVVFFILLTFISFWRGYENNNKKHKVLFGLFFALSLLTRYTALWLAPIFLLYFIFRDKSINFLKDKYLWYSIGIFFLVLLPWFIYGYVYYDNPIGSFIHGFKAANYYGGVQSWNYFFVNFWRIFSSVGIFFILALFYLFFKKEFLKKEVYLFILWAVFFSGMAMSMPHKEDRYILLAIPPTAMISGYFVFVFKKYKYIVLGLVCILLLISTWSAFKLNYSISKDNINVCFNDGNNFLSSNYIEKNSIVMTNQSPIVHYYSRKEIILYPEILSIDSVRNLIDSKYKNRKTYIFFANYDMSLKSSFKNDLDNNFEKVFECKKGEGYAAVYEYK